MSHLRTFDGRGPLAINPSALGEPIQALDPNQRMSAGPVAVLRIHGPLTQYQQNPGWGPLGMLPPPDSYEAIVARAEAAFASEAKAVVLECNSPGGEAAGVFEAAGVLRKLSDRSGKPLLAYVSGQCASACYALACAAETIVAAETAAIGSIGIIEPLVDARERDRQLGLHFELVASGDRKADGNPHAEITKEVREAKAKNVDAMAAIFFSHVAEHRGLKAQAIQGLEAGIFLAAAAEAHGLIDAIGTLDSVVQMAAGTNDQTSASADTENEMKSFKETVDALRAVAEGDDKDEAAKAKKALKAMGEDDESDAKAEDDDEKPEGKKAEGDEEKGAKAKAEDESSEDAKAEGEDDKPAAQASVASAADLERVERRQILAARPDLTKVQVQALAGVPTAALEATLEAIPKASTEYKPPAQPEITLGAGQGASSEKPEIAASSESTHATELDDLMGMGRKGSAITREGNSIVFSAGGDLDAK